LLLVRRRLRHPVGQLGGRPQDALHGFNETTQFALILWALPPSTDYDQTVAAGLDALEYIQAVGRADAVASGPVQGARVEPAPPTGV
jgi:hypothetical protein